MYACIRATRLNRRARSFATILAIALTGVLLVRSIVLAESASELRAGGRQIAGEIAAQKSAGKFDARAQQAAIDRLGKLALIYIDLADRTANAGGEGRDRDALLGAYQVISGPLDDIYDQNSGARLFRVCGGRTP